MKSITLCTLKLLFLMIIVPSGASGGLIHHYKFNSDASDSVGGVDGALIGGAFVNNGKLILDGSGDYVQLTSHIVPANSTNYTVAFFAQQTSPQTGSYIEMMSQGADWYIGHNDSNPAGLRVTSDWLNPGIAFPTDGNSHHFAVVNDGGANKTRLYIDGVLKKTQNGTISSALTGTDTRFGRQYGGFAEYFHGTMDDIRVYNNPLDGAAIADLAQGVPEPAVSMLFAVGLIGIVLVRRRKRFAAT